MSRETYPVSDETFKVLSGRLQEFAHEADKDVSYYNKIKNGVETDPYAAFRAKLFKPGCRVTDAPVEFYLNDLNGIYARSRRLHLPMIDLSGKILEKIQTDSAALSEIVGALSDQKLTKAECHSILAKLAKNKETNDAIERAVQAQLGSLDEQEEKKLRAV